MNTNSFKTGLCLGFLFLGACDSRTNETKPDPALAQAITVTQVATHNTKSDCWIIIDNYVYNVTSYIPLHAGGAQRIISYCGKDATTAFKSASHGTKATEKLATMLAAKIVASLLGDSLGKIQN